MSFEIHLYSTIINSMNVYSKDRLRTEQLRVITSTETAELFCHNK